MYFGPHAKVMFQIAFLDYFAIPGVHPLLLLERAKCVCFLDMEKQIEIHVCSNKDDPNMCQNDSYNWK